MRDFLEYILNDSALAGGGEEDLIDELLAGMLEQSIESADHVAAGDIIWDAAPGNSMKPLNV